MARLFSVWMWISVVALLVAIAVLAVGVLNQIDVVEFFQNIKTIVQDLIPACIGTIYLVAISSAIAIPIGIGTGIYLARFTKKHFLTFIIDILAGTPSIVMGLFGFTMIILIPKATTSLLLSAICIAMLVVPYIVRITKQALETMPQALDLTGISLGMTTWQRTKYLLLPKARNDIFRGIMLAIGRAAEDTAVILLTGVVIDAGIPTKLTDKFEALPFVVYYSVTEYRSNIDLYYAFISTLILITITTLTFYLARRINYDHRN